MDTHKRLHENISALADGELPQSEQELAFAALATADGQATWCAYHVVGDVLRDSAQGALSDGFNATLSARLAREAAHDLAPFIPGHLDPSAASFGGNGANAASAAGAANAANAAAEDHGEPNADVIFP
jgi:sigma-E factor negative regulatory protein RseA